MHKRLFLGTVQAGEYASTRRRHATLSDARITDYSGKIIVPGFSAPRPPFGLTRVAHQAPFSLTRVTNKAPVCIVLTAEADSFSMFAVDSHIHYPQAQPPAVDGSTRMRSQGMWVQLILLGCLLFYHVLCFPT